MLNHPLGVMAGLRAGHPRLARGKKGVDGPDKRGHGGRSILGDRNMLLRRRAAVLAWGPAFMRPFPSPTASSRVSPEGGAPPRKPLRQFPLWPPRAWPL